MRHPKAPLVLFFAAAVLGMTAIAARHTDAAPKRADPIAAAPEPSAPSAPSAPPPISAKRAPDHAIPATAGNAGAGRVLTAPVAGPQGEVIASIPALDRALEVEAPDEAWATQVLEEARKAMPANAQLEQMTVKCVQTFCRVHMVRPVDAQLGWEAVDHAFNDIANGEAIFATQIDGNASTGYLYFAEAQGNLPLDKPAAGTGPWDAPTGDGV